MIANSRQTRKELGICHVRLPLLLLLQTHGLLNSYSWLSPSLVRQCDMLENHKVMDMFSIHT